MAKKAAAAAKAKTTTVTLRHLGTALAERRIGGAMLDVTTPEPLPEHDPLWDLPGTQVTMHLSGRAQNRMFERSAARFLENLARYERGEPLTPQVDYALGY